MIFLEYPKCSTCQKAKKWLDGHQIEYTDRHIVEDNPSYDELKSWYEKSGLPLKKFFNTSGMLYKEMQLKDKLPSMSDEEKLENLIQAIDTLKERVGIKKTIRDYGIDEDTFLARLDDMVEQAFDDQCTGANPRYPLMREIKQMYLNAYYGTANRV